MKSKPQVLILGAGLSGLATAYYLQKKGITFQVLEARNRIGGRVYTIDTQSGGTVEMGATWFAPKHTHLLDLVQELKVPYQQQYTGSKVLYDYADPYRQTRLFDLPAQSDEQYIFTKGTRSLIEAICKELKSNDIELDVQVISIELGNEGVVVHTNQRDYKSEQVVNTLPPNLFVNTIAVEPGLPDELVALSRQTHTWMGESIKVGLEYEEDFWRPAEIGTMLSQFGPASELHDHQHEGSTSRVLKGFLHPDLHPMGMQERQEKVKEQMQLYFDRHAADPTYYEKDWRSDKFTYFPYQRELVPHQNNGHPLFRTSFLDGRLRFAGSESAQIFPGYLDGAVERAGSVAAEISLKML